MYYDSITLNTINTNKTQIQNKKLVICAKLETKHWIFAHLCVCFDRSIRWQVFDKIDDIYSHLLVTFACDQY